MAMLTPTHLDELLALLMEPTGNGSGDAKRNMLIEAVEAGIRMQPPGAYDKAPVHFRVTVFGKTILWQIDMINFGAPHTAAIRFSVEGAATNTAFLFPSMAILLILKEVLRDHTRPTPLEEPKPRKNTVSRPLRQLDYEP